MIKFIFMLAALLFSMEALAQPVQTPSQVCMAKATQHVSVLNVGTVPGRLVEDEVFAKAAGAVLNNMVPITNVPMDTAVAAQFFLFPARPETDNVGLAVLDADGCVLIKGLANLGYFQEKIQAELAKQNV